MSLEGQFSKLKIPHFKGSLEAIGHDYGKRFGRLMSGFQQLETPATETNQKLAKASLSFIERHAPKASEMMQGLARGADQSMNDINRLLLHEEIFHLKALPQPHCSAIAYPGTRTKTRGGIIGQNWDWPPYYIPWGGLVKLTPRNLPRIVAYHFPGLITCCGLNSQGLSLMWTGGGYYPIVRPEIGVPTYALIIEMLLSNSVSEALQVLSDAPRAGSFIFLLADKGGEACVIEATPQRFKVLRGQKQVHYRANLFCTAEIKRSSRQKKPDAKKMHSVGRMNALRLQTTKQAKRVDALAVQRMLSHTNVLVNLPGRSLTLAQFVADCKSGYLYCKDGSEQKTKWLPIKV